jgi:hypothetical protein
MQYVGVDAAHAQYEVVIIRALAIAITVMTMEV